MGAVYPNPWENIYEMTVINYVHETPIRLYVDAPFVNGEGEDNTTPGSSTVLRCEIPEYRYNASKNSHPPTWIRFFRRESADGVNWGDWEEPYPHTMWIDGSVDYDSWEIFTMGYNWQTGYKEARLIVCPPLVRNNYYQYCAAVEGGGVPGTYQAYVSEFILSENNLRYGHADFPPHIDAPLVPRETPIKAAHMLEMQERTNILLDFYKKPLAEFSPIVAEITPLALWKQHVEEIRTALDKIVPEPVAWLDIPVNQPRADVMEQIREVIMSL